MNLRLSRPFALSVLLCFPVLPLLAGCGAAPEASGAAAAQIAAVPAPKDLFARMLRASRDLGPVSGRQTVSFLLLLRDPSASSQQAAINAMYDPHSRQFGHFASPSTLTADRAAKATVGYLRGINLTATALAGADAVRVAGPAALVDRLFRVRADRFRAPNGERFWAARRLPAVPAALRPFVTGAGRIADLAGKRSLIVPVNGMTPAQLLRAYDVTPLRQSGLNGSGQTVAFIEIDGFHQSDFDTFTNHFNLPAMSPTVAFGGRISHSDGEAELDMEVVHAIAPAARLVVYNCPGNCTDSDFVRTENAAVQGTPRGIISISIGGCEQAEDPSTAQAENRNFQRADALGESVLVASGDSGAFECLTENWGAPPGQHYIGTSSPAVVPSVTAVGGTRLSLNQDASWYKEEAWEEPAETAGTGGGVSAYFGRPSWQRGPGVNNIYDTDRHREIPDVAAAADPLSSAQVVINGSLIEEGGTSQAAPIWAGITALMNQYLAQHGGHALGFLNPALYALAAGSPAYPPFHDVTLGTNLVYPAGPNYDLATGLGSPDAWNLVRDLATYQKGGGA